MSVHDWFASHLVVADAAANATSIEVALISAFALVVGGTLQQILSRKDKEPVAWKNVRTAQHDLVVNLREQLAEKDSDYDELQRNFNNAMEGMTLRDQENTRLRDLCWAHGINPNPKVSNHPAPPPSSQPPEGTLPT